MRTRIVCPITIPLLDYLVYIEFYAFLVFLHKLHEGRVILYEYCFDHIIYFDFHSGAVASIRLFTLTHDLVNNLKM